MVDSKLKIILANLRDAIYEDYKVARDIPLKQRRGNPPHFFYNKALGVQAAMELIDGLEYRLVEQCDWTKEPDLPIYVEGDDISYTTQCGVNAAFKDGPFCSCGNRIEIVESDSHE